MSRKRRDDDDLNVFDLFGVAPEMPPALKEALTRLADAVCDLPGRSRDFQAEPDLAALSWAVQDVLEASGHQEAVGAVARWVDYEVSGRQRSKRAEAWLRCDALFRLDVEAAKVGGWEAMDAAKEVSGRSRPLLPLPTDKPESPPTE